MEWLKKILGEAYTEDIQKGIAAELKKNYVPRTDYEQLQTTAQTATETHEKAFKDFKIRKSAEIALREAKCKNLKLGFALLDLENAELENDDTVKGLADQIKAITTAEDSKYVFDTAEPAPPSFNGFQPPQGSDSNKPPAGSGKDPKNMTYGVLCEYLKDNPNAKL